MKKLILFSFAIIAMTTTAFQCCKENNNTALNNCEDRIMACDDRFNSVDISVKDSKMNEVPMDEVIISIDGNIIRILKSPNLNTKSNYTIADDSFMQLIPANDARQLLVVGKVGSIVKFVREYPLISDCCHITLGKIDPIIILN
jgi:hypothetical protein